MSLRVLVCLKAALDPVQALLVAGSPPTLQPESSDPIYTLGPADRAALEYALGLKETRGAEVTALSLGGPPCESILTIAIAAGTDLAIHLSCDDAAIPDAWTAAKIVASAVADGEYEIVLCGDASLDDGSGVFGPFLGEILGWAQISRAIELDYDPQTKTLTALRILEHGDRQRVKCQVPVVVSVNPFNSRPRYISVHRLKKADRSLIRRIDTQVYPQESQLKIVEMSPARARPRRMAAPGAGLSAAKRMQLMMGRGEMSKPAAGEKLFEGSVEAAAERIVRYLQENGLI